MRSLGHELTKEGANDRLALPCAYFSCGSCGIYDRRFAACRAYECALLRRYHAGEVGLAEARTIIEEARERIETAAAANPGCAMREKRVATRKMLENRVKKASPEERAAIGTKLLSLAALDYFLSEHFEVKANQPAASECADSRSDKTDHEIAARR